VTLEKFRHREHRPDAHLIRLATRDRESAKDQLRLNTQRLCSLARHQQRRRSSIGQLRRVPRRHRSLPARLIEVRLERGQSLERRVRAIALIAIADVLFAARDLTGLLVEYSASHFHRRELLFEKTIDLRACNSLLAR